MRTRIVLAAIAFVALAGCASTTADHATASPPTDTSTSALPGGFPDLSSFPTVDANDYRQSYPYFNGIRFTTPGGLSCDQNAMNSLSDPNDVVLTCAGPRPDKGPGDWSITVATTKAASIEPTSDDPPEGDPIKTLPPQHTISYKGIQCGVDASGTTACRVGEHGFVLTPTETRLF
jgi:hypothetical protein